MADSIPLEGDLSPDASWIHLFINNTNVTSHRESQISNETLMHGIGEDSEQKGVVTFPLRSIAHIEERRFELRDLALELFFNRMCNIPPVMIAFRSKKARSGSLSANFGWSLQCSFGIENCRRYPSQRLRDACAGILGPFSTPYIGQATRGRLLDAQVAWLRGQMSNFDYLMALNSAAGRTYNDITQYKYSFDEEQRSILCPVYHYSSFCSNEAIILHLLFRLIPVAFRLIQFQAKHVKELIPEFFFRSDLFTNHENFELGTRHDGILVDGVELPP
ncbi:unnamed protein product [Rodentolepis nana]|uniref:BEACH-type PH domain-containing protein n=1 Tax=Rodentolepis nana TaxID=102285 RepID=A0A0R3U0Q6_RODNA|nr:unnamed protein product [Rodentolepis nana]